MDLNTPSRGNLDIENDKESITSEINLPNILKKDWIQKSIQKIKKAFESEESRKMLQVFLVDPVLNYILERIFPYIMIICVMFVVLTVLTSGVVAFLFMKMPGIISTTKA